MTSYVQSIVISFYDVQWLRTYLAQTSLVYDPNLGSFDVKQYVKFPTLKRLVDR